MEKNIHNTQQISSRDLYVVIESSLDSGPDLMTGNEEKNKGKRSANDYLIRAMKKRLKAI